MRQLFPIVGLVLIGGLSCPASENPSITNSDHSNLSSQASCRRTSNARVALKPLLLSGLRLPEITPLAWDGLSTGGEPNDDDKGCCLIGKGTAGADTEYVTWRQCKSDAKQVGDDSPEFEKGKSCPSR
jgi:hypothetical protein